jgi:hypothetical protein
VEAELNMPYVSSFEKRAETRSEERGFEHSDGLAQRGEELVSGR